MNSASETPTSGPLTIWTMTSGAAGMRSQVNGLAKALGRLQPVSIEEKIIELKSWAVPLPGHLNPAPLHSLKATHPIPAPPWPAILITSGRRASGTSIAIGRKSHGRTFRIHLQNPQTPLSYFDLVCSMRHDHLKGDNVLETITALHQLTKEDIEQGAAPFQDQWQNQLEKPGRGPALGVLLGGKNKNSGFDQSRLEDLIGLIQTSINTNNANIFITPSRRTEPFVIKALTKAFKEHPNVWIWNNTDPNPYLALLHHSDHILVTSDSVSMISEALYTSKPVHIFPLSHQRKRLQQFISYLSTAGVIHMAENTINYSVDAHREPIDETAKIAQIIIEKLNAHRMA